MINEKAFAKLSPDDKVKVVDLVAEQKKLHKEWDQLPSDSERAAEICKRDGEITFQLREIQGLNAI